MPDKKKQLKNSIKELNGEVDILSKDRETLKKDYKELKQTIGKELSEMKEYMRRELTGFKVELQQRDTQIETSSTSPALTQ